MNRSNILYVALATMTLATSCAQDELQSSQAAQSEISFNASMGLRTRAENNETDLTNLKTSGFYVSAFQGTNANYMTNVKYTWSEKWIPPTGETYFWPVSTESNLEFYAYAYGHKDSQTALSGVTIKSGTKEIKDFSPAIDNTGTAETNKADAKAQEDLIYACVSGNKTSNATGVDLTFKHALSEISVKATNSNTAYQIKVTGVKLGNINSQGTFKFADATTSATSDGTWNDLKTPVAYETDFTGDNAVTLDATEKNVDASTPFILIPQTCKKGEESSKSKYSVGHYIALNVTISMKNGTSYEGGATYKGWAFVGINTTWQQGYHYTYILDFSKGAGQDADGNQIISGSDILIKSVTVSKFTETDIKDTNMKGVEDND